MALLILDKIVSIITGVVGAVGLILLFTESNTKLHERLIYLIIAIGLIYASYRLWF